MADPLRLKKHTKKTKNLRRRAKDHGTENVPQHLKVYTNAHDLIREGNDKTLFPKRQDTRLRLVRDHSASIQLRYRYLNGQSPHLSGSFVNKTFSGSSGLGSKALDASVHESLFFVVVFLSIFFTLFLTVGLCRRWAPDFVLQWSQERANARGAYSDYMNRQRMAEQRERMAEEQRLKKVDPVKLKQNLETMMGGYTMVIKETDFVAPDAAGQGAVNKDVESGTALSVEPDDAKNAKSSAEHNENNKNADSNMLTTGEDAENESVPSALDASLEQSGVVLCLRGRQTVPNFCAICLCTYEAGDTVMWSNNPDCPHAFHNDCILFWLMKMMKKKAEDSDENDVSGTMGAYNTTDAACPCCRREFVCQVIVSEKTGETAVEPRRLSASRALLQGATISSSPSSVTESSDSTESERNEHASAMDEETDGESPNGSASLSPIGQRGALRENEEETVEFENSE